MVLEKLVKILERAADAEDIKHYEVYPHVQPLTGNGFIGEFYTGDIKNKDTGEIIHTYIKKILKHAGPFGSDAFYNENYFYSYILPELKKFQREKGVKIPFTNIPKFYGCGNEPGEQYLVIENLKIQTYDILDKSLYIDADTLRMIFGKYGKYHALTFAFKDQNLEKHTELVSPLKDMYIIFGASDEFMLALQRAIKAAYDGLKTIDVEIAEKIKPYVENIKESYREVMSYDGQFSGLIHGDCWSNNMLFKFGEDEKVEDVKFIDFQLCRNSTPIHDLSYFFYSGASGEDFDKLDEYLELYHKSFTAFAKELGSDPEKILPLSALKSEWIKHSLLGMLMALVLWQVKLTEKDKIEGLTSEDGVESFQKSVKLTLQSDTFIKNTSDILIHAVKYGIL